MLPQFDTHGNFSEPSKSAVACLHSTLVGICEHTFFPFFPFLFFHRFFLHCSPLLTTCIFLPVLVATSGINRARTIYVCTLSVCTFHPLNALYPHGPQHPNFFFLLKNSKRSSFFPIAPLQRVEIWECIGHFSYLRGSQSCCCSRAEWLLREHAPGGAMQTDILAVKLVLVQTCVPAAHFALSQLHRLPLHLMYRGQDGANIQTMQLM